MHLQPAGRQDDAPLLGERQDVEEGRLFAASLLVEAVIGTSGRPWSSSAPRCDRTPGQRLLPPIDQRLHEARAAIVVVSKAFLGFTYSRKELDGLATRRKVIAILSDVGEADVSKYSPRLAVAAFSGSLSERLVCLLRTED